MWSLDQRLRSGSSRLKSGRIAGPACSFDLPDTNPIIPEPVPESFW